VKAPTRALIVEDIRTWAYTLSRAARRAGVSEIVVCETLHDVREALRSARFDVAILDVGLDPDDDRNSDGIGALESIREMDGGGTRCVLVTGWQGGDRMALQARVHEKFGVDGAYMKEKYDARALIDKLTDLLEKASARRLSLPQKTPMENLCANVEPLYFEADLISTLSPKDGVQTLYSVVSRLLSSAIPLIARRPAKPMEEGSDGAWAGVYWSRALATAVAVGLAPATGWQIENAAPAYLRHLVPGTVVPELIDSARERNVEGWLFELPQLSIEQFPANTDK
jgi:ActR/RegA family two-component response regulator